MMSRMKRRMPVGQPAIKNLRVVLHALIKSQTNYTLPFKSLVTSAPKVQVRWVVGGIRYTDLGVGGSGG